MAVDFKHLLNKPMDEIERPKPLPAGTYMGIITKYEFGESAQKKTPFLRYSVQPTEAGDDVDPDAIAGMELSSKSLRRDYFLTNEAMYRLKEFLESCGIDTSGRSMGECIPESNRARVILSVTQRSSEDGTEIYNDVREMKGAA